MHLKGGLHIHTTCSDGELSIEEVIRVYSGLGFDFIALTDHDFLLQPDCYKSITKINTDLIIFNEIKDKCPDLEKIIEVSENPADGHISFADLLAEEDDTPVESDADPEDIAFIFYTSGTTGNPKGEEIKVFVVAEDDSLTEEEVIEYCKEHLAGFKVPKFVELLEEDFPGSPIGKVLKKTLREWGLKGGPKSKGTEVTVADIFGTMESRVIPEGVAGITANYGYIITGTDGGEFTVCVDDGTVQVKEGIHDPNVTTTCSAKDWGSPSLWASSTA
ncbi:MAG: AMP-binding protein [Dissulfuribacterales bacterium]